MLNMVRYQTGEIRVEDRETMRCSDWLDCVNPEIAFEDYNLDYEISDSEPEGSTIF